MAAAEVTRKEERMTIMTRLVSIGIPHRPTSRSNTFRWPRNTIQMWTRQQMQRRSLPRSTMRMKLWAMRTRDASMTRQEWQVMSRLRIPLEARIHSREQMDHLARDSQGLKALRASLPSLTGAKDLARHHHLETSLMSLRRCLGTKGQELAVKPRPRAKTSCWTWRLISWRQYRDHKRLWLSHERTYVEHVRELSASLALRLPRAGLVGARDSRRSDKVHLWFNRCVGCVMELAKSLGVRAWLAGDEEQSMAQWRRQSTFPKEWTAESIYESLRRDMRDRVDPQAI